MKPDIIIKVFYTCIITVLAYLSILVNHNNTQLMLISQRLEQQEPLQERVSVLEKQQIILDLKMEGIKND